MILDKAGQKGTGKWSAIEAQNMGVPATGIEAAVAARSISSFKTEREAAEKIFGLSDVPALAVADKAAFIKDLESALLAGKITDAGQSKRTRFVGAAMSLVLC